MRIVHGLLLAALCAAPASAQNADTVLLNGKIVTLEAAGTVEALAVTDGRIVATGTSDEIAKLAGPATRRIDLGGRTVIPGLINSHMHAIRAALFYATEVNWIGAKSIPEAMERIREKAKAAKPGEWIIVAGGWTPPQFAEKRRPTQAELVAAAPDNPVYIQLFYSNVLLTPGGLCGAQYHQGRGRAAARQARARCRGQADRLDFRRQSDDLGPVRQAAAADVRAERRRNQAVLPRAQSPRAHRRERSGRVQPDGRELPAAVPGLAGQCAHRAGDLFAVRAAARQGAGRHPGDDADAADGLRRRLAALQRHRRERHLGPVQQRRADRRAEAAVLRDRQVGGVARHDADAALEQQQVGASPARRDRAGEQGSRRSRSCAGRWCISTTPRRRASRA